MKLLVNLDVDDLDQAVQFYGAAFGLTVGWRFGASGVEMLGSPVPVYLLLKEPESPAADTTTHRRTYKRHWTPVHLDFVVDDIIQEFALSQHPQPRITRRSFVVRATALSAASLTAPGLVRSQQRELVVGAASSQKTWSD